MAVRVVLLAAAAVLFSPTAGSGQSGLRTVVTVLTAAGAAESLRRSAHDLERFQKEDAILQDLKKQNVSTSNSAIYSVYLKTTGGYWADLFSKPDFFLLVDIEGKGTFLVPQIRWNHAASTPILEKILSEHVSAGSRVVVRVMDDDTTSDAIWNQILKTRVNFRLSGGVALTKYISATAAAGGTLQLLESKTVMDAPETVATAEFVVPESQDGVWFMNGQLIDSSGADVGTVQLACIWSARAEVEAQTETAASWFGSSVFWGVLGGCLLLVFVVSLVSTNNSEVVAESNQQGDALTGQAASVRPSRRRKSFHFPCPHCQGRLRVPNKLAGRTLQCPRCQGEITPAKSS